MQWGTSQNIQYVLDIVWRSAIEIINVYYKTIEIFGGLEHCCNKHSLTDVGVCPRTALPS